MTISSISYQRSRTDTEPAAREQAATKSDSSTQNTNQPSVDGVVADKVLGGQESVETRAQSEVAATRQGTKRTSTVDALTAGSRTKRATTGEKAAGNDLASNVGQMNSRLQDRTEAPPSFSEFAKRELKRELDKQFPGENIDPDETYVVHFKNKTETDADGKQIQVRTATEFRSLTDEFLDGFENGRTPAYVEEIAGVYRVPSADESKRISGSNVLFKLESAIDDARDKLKSNFQSELTKYWNEPLTINGATDTRKFHVAEAEKTLMSRRAALGVLDGELTREDQARIDRLRTYPNSAERVDDKGQPKSDMPAVYAISVPNAPAPGGKTEFSGMYIITERQIAGEIDANTEVGAVLLNMPGRPLESYPSLQALNEELGKRLTDPARRQTLLQHIPARAQAQLAGVGNASGQFVSFSFQSIEGNVFENRLQSMIDQQVRDVGDAEGVDTSVRNKLDMEPYLAERDQRLLEQAERNSWPDWRKHASESDRSELAQHERVKQHAQESADQLLDDVDSPRAYGRDQATRYLNDKFGTDADPNEIQVRAEYTTRTGPQARTGTLLDFLQEGPRDASRGDVTYSVIRSADSPVPLTDAQLKQTLGELDVRKDYGSAVETTYRNPDVKNALSDVLDSQIQMDAFSAKMRGHLTQSDYDMVQRARDPAKTPAGATTQVSVGGVSIHLPGKAADQMKDALVFRETKADGQVERYILYVPNSPDGQNFYGFNNWQGLSASVAAWTVKPEGRQYLQDQLDPGNRSHATQFFEDAALRSDTWRIAENGTATWKELPGTSYRDKLDAAVAEKSQTRVAEAKVGTISPDWYQHASPAERQKLTSLADRIRVTKEAMSSALPGQPFPDYAHGKIKESLDRYLRTKGGTETVDPDTVMVDLGDGTSPRTLTDVATYGYDSSDNFVGKARFTSSTGQDLSQLNTAVRGAEQGARRRGAFAEYMDPFVRGGYLGEQYTREIEQQYLTEGPALENRRALYREHVQSTMLYDAAQAKLRGELTEAEYTSVKQQIEETSLPAGRSPETRMPHRLTFNGRPVEGTYVFRGVGAVGQARNMLYTPGAPDGRMFRPYDDSTFRSGKDEPRSLTEAMANYYYQRVKYSDQAVANTRLEKLQKGQEKPDALLQPVLDLNREYDRKLQLTLDPVRETTKTRGQVISEQVWKGVNYAGAAISLVYPPAGIAVGTLMWGKEMHDAYEAYRRGDRASASLSILSAGAEAIGVGFDAADGLKAVGKGLASVRKTLGLKVGQHFGTVDEAAKALKQVNVPSPSTAFKDVSPLKPELAVKAPPNESAMALHTDGFLSGVYEEVRGDFSTYYVKEGNAYYEVVPDANKRTLGLADPRNPNARYHLPIAQGVDGRWAFASSVYDKVDLSGYASLDALPVGAEPKSGSNGIFDFQGNEYVKTDDGRWRETSYENGKRYIKHSTQTGQKYEVVPSDNSVWSVQPRSKLYGGGGGRTQTEVSTRSRTEPTLVLRLQHPQRAQLSRLVDTLSRANFNGDVLRTNGPELIHLLSSDTNRATFQRLLDIQVAQGQISVALRHEIMSISDPYGRAQRYLSVIKHRSSVENIEKFPDQLKEAISNGDIAASAARTVNSLIDQQRTDLATLAETLSRTVFDRVAADGHFAFDSELHRLLESGVNEGVFQRLLDIQVAQGQISVALRHEIMSISDPYGRAQRYLSVIKHRSSVENIEKFPDQLKEAISNGDIAASAARTVNSLIDQQRTDLATLAETLSRTVFDRAAADGHFAFDSELHRLLESGVNEGVFQRLLDIQVAQGQINAATYVEIRAMSDPVNRILRYLSVIKSGSSVDDLAKFPDQLKRAVEMAAEVNSPGARGADFIFQQRAQLSSLANDISRADFNDNVLRTNGPELIHLLSSDTNQATFQRLLDIQVAQGQISVALRHEIMSISDPYGRAQRYLSVIKHRSSVENIAKFPDQLKEAISNGDIAASAARTVNSLIDQQRTDLATLAETLSRTVFDRAAADGHFAFDSELHRLLESGVNEGVFQRLLDIQVAQGQINAATYVEIRAMSDPFNRILRYLSVIKSGSSVDDLAKFPDQLKRAIRRDGDARYAM
ncbi:DUF6543 domain-containing protein [Burkholderia sp. 572]|uniref:dermonecrotic toxin domain-containing protein n=1 Tax=Burkholderia sp. 572 TaxID=3156414 RepID=UPI003392A196